MPENAVRRYRGLERPWDFRGPVIRMSVQAGEASGVAAVLKQLQYFAGEQRAGDAQVEGASSPTTETRRVALCGDFAVTVH
jgi:hypothetical protein